MLVSSVGRGEKNCCIWKWRGHDQLCFKLQSKQDSSLEIKNQGALYFFSPTTARAGDLRAATHEQGTSGRQHEQGTNNNLQRSSRRSSSLMSRTSLRELEVQDELEGARGPGVAGTRG
ncbi:hypothetical protein VPH35_007856 [Triticum aestivum]